MSEKHKISNDVMIAQLIGGAWTVSSKVAIKLEPHGSISFTPDEIDAIHAFIHEDDEGTAPDPEVAEVAETEEITINLPSDLYEKVARLAKGNLMTVNTLALVALSKVIFDHSEHRPKE